MPSAELKIRVEEQSLERLDELARATGRSADSIAADAIDAYLDIQDWRKRAVECAIASLDAGRGVPQEEIEAWAQSLIDASDARPE